jgi:hypothetical protein
MVARPVLELSRVRRECAAESKDYWRCCAKMWMMREGSAGPICVVSAGVRASGGCVVETVDKLRKTAVRKENCCSFHSKKHVCSCEMETQRWLRYSPTRLQTWSELQGRISNSVYCCPEKERIQMNDALPFL